MTHWPYCIAEIGLYSLFVGLVIAMALDVRGRWGQLRPRDHAVERDDAEHAHDDERAVSAVRRKHQAEHDQDDEPPLAS